MRNERARAFLASSEQSLPHLRIAARCLQRLVPEVQFTLWKSADNWESLHSTLSKLSEHTNKYFYGIFLGYPDDLVKWKNDKGTIETTYKTRDNVTFEFGLFFSKNDKHRTFFLSPTIRSTTASYKNPSDLGSSEFVFPYKVTPRDNGSGLHKFDVDRRSLMSAATAIGKKIQKYERERCSLTPTQATAQLKGWSDRMRSEITTLSDVEMTHLFGERIRKLISLRAAKNQTTVSDAIEDLLDVLQQVEDVVDLKQLSQEQSKKTVKAVWVLADPPIELDPPSPRGQNDVRQGIDALRETIIANLLRRVDYTYFVPKFPSALDSFEKQIKKRIQLEKRRTHGKITVIVTDPRYFKTFFTVHFHAEKLSSKPTVYQSVITPSRADLLFQLDEGHAKRVLARLRSIRGEPIRNNTDEDEVIVRAIDYNLAPGD